mgnify:CR=1 FL=1
MEQYIKEFTNYLVAEKNASPHTLKSYLNDISQFKGFLNESGHAGESFIIASIDRLAIRSYLGFLYDNSGAISPTLNPISCPKDIVIMKQWINERVISFFMI